MDLNMPGLYNGVPEKIYLDLTHASRSDLQLILRSPAHYWSARLDPQREPEEETPAKRAGKILHTCILEPEKFERRFIIVPADAPRRPSSAQRGAKNPSGDTLFAIDWWDSFEESNKDKEIIKAEEWVKFHKIAKSVRSHPELSAWMSEGHAEITVIAKDPETGLLCRARPDFLTTIDRMTIMLDLKSSEDARPDFFMKSAWNYGYFHQHVWYRDCFEYATGKAPDLFLLAAFEKEPPYAVKLYEPAEDSLDRARQDNRKALHLMAECRDKGLWPSYSTDIERLHMPGWVKPNA
jgi:exodeoxyribonuclease VIII